MKNYLSCFRSNESSFVLLKLRRQWPSGIPSAFHIPDSIEEVSGFLPPQLGKDVSKQTVLHWLPGETCWLQGTHTQCWNWPSSLSFLFKGKNYSIQCLTVLYFPWFPWYPDAKDWNVCSPVLRLVIGSKKYSDLQVISVLFLLNFSVSLALFKK